jgi:hypothetical protein
VKEAKEARGRHPTAGEGEKKKPARKPAAKKKSA